MPHVQATSHGLELTFQVQHQCGTGVSGESTTQRLAGTGDRVIDLAQGQVLGRESRAHGLAGIEKALDPALRTLEGRQGFRLPAETGQISGVLLRRDPLLGFRRPGLGAHQLQQGRLIVSESGDAGHQTIPINVSYMSLAACISRAEALKAC